MAQTIAEIKKQITDAFMADPAMQAAYGTGPGETFDSVFSPVSIESILFGVVAWIAWLTQKLFDAHRDEVKATLDTQRPHTLRWYAAKALLYQDGDSLPADTDEYDNTGKTDAHVLNARVVKLAAASEVLKGIRIKAAKYDEGAAVPITPLSAAQLAGLTTYMGRVKDAGVRLYVESNPPDALSLSLVIYYDALLLDASGARLDGTAATPVSDAINAFLQAQSFNGLFVLARLVDALQAVPGVVIPEVVIAKARYGALPWAKITVEYLPDAGYLSLDPADLTIQYLPHEPL